MRKVISIAIGLLLAAGSVAVWAHDGGQEKKANDELTVSADLRVGQATLPAGEYRVVCDRHQITFTRIETGKRYQVPCKGKELDTKADATKVMTNLDKSGVRYLDKLLIKGSTVEHVFD